MKILVISLAGIGDTLFATPLIHELRANFPDATIDVLTKEAGARDLLESNPHVNRVFYKNLLRCSRLATLRFLGSLRREQFAAQHAAGFYFLPLNQPIHGVIVDAKQVGGFLNGIRQPFGGRHRAWW